MEVEKSSLAYELLQEVKRSSKRWFILSMVELIIIIGMIIGFFMYESQFEYATTIEQSQETENVTSSNLMQTVN